MHVCLYCSLQAQRSKCHWACIHAPETASSTTSFKTQLCPLLSIHNKNSSQSEYRVAQVSLHAHRSFIQGSAAISFFPALCRSPHLQRGPESRDMYGTASSLAMPTTTPLARLTGTRLDIVSLLAPHPLFVSANCLLAVLASPPYSCRPVGDSFFTPLSPSPMAGCRASCEAVVGPAIGCAHLFLFRR